MTVVERWVLKQVLLCLILILNYLFIVSDWIRKAQTWVPNCHSLTHMAQRLRVPMLSGNPLMVIQTVTVLRARVLNRQEAMMWYEKWQKKQEWQMSPCLLQPVSGNRLQHYLRLLKFPNGSRINLPGFSVTTSKCIKVYTSTTGNLGKSESCKDSVCCEQWYEPTSFLVGSQWKWSPQLFWSWVLQRTGGHSWWKWWTTRGCGAKHDGRMSVAVTRHHYRKVTLQIRRVMQKRRMFAKTQENQKHQKDLGPR